MTRATAINPSYAAVVVNDDATQLRLLTALLQKAGLEVFSFASAEAALAALDPERPPALIVTDLYMPGLDGWRFCRLLRSAEYAAFNKTPIMIVSATYSGIEAAQVTAELGANAFLTTPVRGSELIEQARRLIAGEIPHFAPRVLIVEDAPSLSVMLAGLYQARGYEPDVAPDGHAAREKFAAIPYDLVILDHHLPDAGGDALLVEFIAQRPEAVFIMTTSDIQPRLALEWMKLGASAYVHKPFEPEYLFEMCEKARRERALLRIPALLERRTRELFEQEKRFRTFLANASDAVIVLDRDSILIFISGAYQAITGYTIEEHLNKDPWNLIHSDDVTQVKKVFQDLLSQPGITLRKEWRFRHREGQWIWLEGAATNPAETHGIDGIVVNIRDITERKRAEDTLRESEFLLRESQIVAGLGSYVLNVSTGMWKSSEMLDRIFGIDADYHRSVEGWVALIHPGDRVMMDRYFKEEVIGQNRPFDKEYRIIRDDTRDERRVHGMGKLDFDAQGCPLAMYGTIQDITERRQAEEHKQLLEAQLQQSRKLESLGQLAGGVAHDLNNMITPILGYGEMLMDECMDSSPLHEGLAQIVHAAERARDLVHQLLAFARQQPTEVKPINPARLLADFEKMLRRTLRENIDLGMLANSRDSIILGDTGQLTQVILNLAINAQDAMPHGGALRIQLDRVALTKGDCDRMAVEAPGDYVLMTVSDTGDGMDEPTLRQIFDPFFTTKPLGKGTGLGLATVYGVVTQMGGAIQVESQPGRGTTFRLYFPLTAASQPGAKTPRNRKAAAGNETILVVEDQDAVRDLTCRILRRSGYKVSGQHSPEDALQFAASCAEPIHLLLTDVIMPGLNGLELYEKMLALKPEIKVLYMSGYTSDLLGHWDGLEKGINFIPKPFNIESITAKVRQILES